MGNVSKASNAASGASSLLTGKQQRERKARIARKAKKHQVGIWLDSANEYAQLRRIAEALETTPSVVAKLLVASAASQLDEAVLAEYRHFAAENKPRGPSDSATGPKAVNTMRTLLQEAFISVMDKTNEDGRMGAALHFEYLRSLPKPAESHFNIDHADLAQMDADVSYLANDLMGEDANSSTP